MSQFIWPATRPEKLRASRLFGAPRPYRDGIHQGVDIGILGEPVRAAAAGKILRVGPAQGYGGERLWIDHGNGWQTRYFHVEAGSYSKSMVGQRVSQGQQIARVGATGIKASDPHLHFEVHRRGVKLDPEKHVSYAAAGDGLLLVGAAIAALWWLA